MGDSRTLRGGTNLWNCRALAYAVSTSREEGDGERTFPYAGPEDVTIIDVHHDPLTIERVLVDGAAEG